MTSSGNRLRPDRGRIGRVAHRPNAGFATFDRQLAAHQQPMLDIETRPAELADLRCQLHDIAEPCRGKESRAGVDQRNADDPESAG